MARNLGARGLRPMQWALCLLLSLCPGGAEGRSARRVAVTDDTVVRLATQVRHTTVLAVPADERILEFVLGDRERWGLAGAANVALLKPMAAGARTSVTLVTDAGRIYAFTAEEGTREPDLMVYVRRGGPRPARAELPGAAAVPAPVPVAAAALPPAPELDPGPVPVRGPLPAPVAVPALPPAAEAIPPVPEPAPVPVPEPVPVSVTAHAIELPAVPPAAAAAPRVPAVALVQVPEPAVVPVQVPAAVTAPDGEQSAIALAPVPTTAPAVESPALPPADEAAPVRRSPAAAPRGTMRFEYALDAAARGDPFRVVAMWNDGERT